MAEAEAARQPLPLLVLSLMGRPFSTIKEYTTTIWTIYLCCATNCLTFAACWLHLKLLHNNNNCQLSLDGRADGRPAERTTAEPTAHSQWRRIGRPVDRPFIRSLLYSFHNHLTRAANEWPHRQQHQHQRPATAGQ